ncbi:hypothetical protein F4861DRAFT_74631 [Xylaria intraflava]|nr:hypothetical protein F4861DRAFT_74631 [Xylaria intraflava]
MPCSNHTYSTGQLVTQSELGAILSQLKTDLIVATRSVRPPMCQTCFASSYHFDSAESSVEDAIKTCVDGALKRWAPEFYINSSVTTDAFDWKPGCAEPLLLGSSRFFDPPSEPPEPSLFDSAGGFEPLLLPDEGSVVFHPMSAELSDNCAKPSLDMERVEGSNKNGRRHNRRTWERHREALKQLYVVQSLPLPVVMRKMKEEHGFSATVKQYRYQLSEIWKWRKYNSGNATKSGFGPDTVELVDKESVEDCNSSSSTMEEPGV